MPLYISFYGTNLLTQCLVLVAVFCLFLPFQKIVIKKCPNEKKNFGLIFSGPEETHEASREDQKSHEEAISLEGAPRRVGAPPRLVGPS